MILSHHGQHLLDHTTVKMYSLLDYNTDPAILANQQEAQYFSRRHDWNTKSICSLIIHSLRHYHHA